VHFVAQIVLETEVVRNKRGSASMRAYGVPAQGPQHPRCQRPNRARAKLETRQHHRVGQPQTWAKSWKHPVKSF